MKHACIYILFLIASLSQAAEPKRSTTTEQYIKQYSALAVKQQKRFGVPASITLAQAIIETGSGTSRMAKVDHNHFGIKCHTAWRGAKAYYDDDKKHECFRKYKSVEESYEDHSIFLKENSRYAQLFKYKVTDYVHWARGLQQFGYATNKAYANALIKCIEDYKLYEYDGDKGKKVKQATESEKGKDASPSQPAGPRLTVHKSQGGLSFVYAPANSSIETVAAQTGVSVKDLLKFNEMPDDFPIQDGAIIYTVKKKKKAEKPNFDHIVQVGESMHSISQKYGIRVKSLYKLNRKKEDYIPTEGEILKLR